MPDVKSREISVKNNCESVRLTFVNDGKRPSLVQEVLVKSFLSLVLVFLIAIALFSAAPARAEEKGDQFNAFLNPTGQPTSKTVPVQIVIKEYTSDADLASYKAMIVSEGQDALVKSIRKNNLGFCRVGSNVGQQIFAARSVALPDGTRKVTAVYGSVTGDFQVRSATKAGDFPFALVEMVIKPDYSGDGMLVPAVGITVNKDGSLDLQNFGAYPARMMNLHQDKPKEK